ncbi:MAG: hypothetical protein PHT50_01375 [Candidatus Omnitrophica bacterium]|nr:hypothetical protein [Candidatus Omnitrophota bacterium]
MKTKHKSLILASFFIFVFLNYLSRFEGPASGYWDTYITAPAFFITNHHINFVSKDGQNLYNYMLPGKIPQNLVAKDTYGVISKDQRIGTGIMFAPWFLFFKLFGFRLLFAFIGLLIAVFTYLTLRYLGLRSPICLFGALAATLNPYMLSLNKLNPNVAGMMFISIIIYLILSKKTSWLLIGLIYGIFGGVRNEGILFIPAITYFLYISSNRKIRDALLFFCGAFTTIIPMLYWNYFAFGNMFMHPTQFSGLEGFRPTFQHRFLFWKFSFNGMLNWPLYTQIVRTPYFAFPVFLLLPLILINSFGVILSALAVNGAVRFFKEKRRLFIFLMLWFLPMYILLSAMENWSELKTTFLLLCISPIIICISFGLEELTKKISSPRYIIRTASLAAIIWGAVRLLIFTDFQADPRWYLRFPRVLQKGEISFIGDDLRTRPEDPKEILAQKKALTSAKIIPPIPWQKIDFYYLAKKVSSELNQDNLTTIDFWRYIYEH